MKAIPEPKFFEYYQLTYVLPHFKTPIVKMMAQIGLL